MHEPQIEFEWDEAKAASNAQKHDISFELASTVFNDPRLLTFADLARSVAEERWFSVGLAASGAILAVVYLWSETGPGFTTIRIISARKATHNEIHQYEGNL